MTKNCSGVAAHPGRRVTKATSTEIGASLRRVREMRGLSQRELARKAGLSPTAVSQIECGTIAEPSQPTLDALNKAMRSWIGLVPARRRAIDCALARYREQVAAKSTTPEEIEWLQEHLTQEVFLLLDPGNMHRAILSRRQRRA